MGITSYAQNFEDVMLWRALGHIPNGLYIDVGAQHPIVDSVSKAFYEHGWRGIHVEPTTTYANLLRADRPDEVVIQAALSNHTGTVQFYEIAETGLSTADSAIAARHQEQGFAITETVVPCMTLADVFNLTADKDIHWLKVDVEGFERQVLEGWANSPALPWIIVVESTLPLTTIETHENWEALLLERGYRASYFDGLNRYYLAPTHPELLTAFQAGPNVFDNFYLYGKASATFCHLVHEHHNAELSQIQHTAQQEITRLNESLANQQAELALQGQTLGEQLRVANETTRKLEIGLLDQSRTSLEKEQVLIREHTHQVELLIQQLQTTQAELLQLSREGTAREKVLTQQTTQVRQEMEVLLRTIGRRESEFTKELQQTLREANQVSAQQAQIYVEQERVLRQELVERERVLTQQIDKLRQEAAELLQLQTQRESEFAKELLKTHKDADQSIAQQAQLYVEQERALRQELVERERVLTQQIDKLRQEAAELLQLQTQRESEFAKELLQTHHVADQRFIEQTKQHSAREEILHRDYFAHQQALNEQLLAKQEELRGTEALHHERERTLSQRLSEKQEELIRLMQTHSSLEAELRKQIAAEQQAYLYVQASLDSIRNSLMWRITSPIRAITNIFSKSPLKKSQLETTKITTPIVISPTVKKVSSTPENLPTPNTTATHPPCEPNMSTQQSINHLANPTNGKLQANYLLSLNDGEFVEQAYLAILNRAPDAEGFNYYLNRVRQGYSKKSILAQILQSAEAKNIDIKIEELKISIKLLNFVEIPIIGNILALFGVETNNIKQRQLRRIENKLYILDQEISQNFRHLEKIINNENSKQVIDFRSKINKNEIKKSNINLANHIPETTLQPTPEAVQEWIEILTNN